MRHRAAVPARREHLAGQHPAVHAGDLADAADEPAQRAAVGVLVALLLEDHEVDGAGDQHVGRVDRQPFGGLDGVGGDAVEHLERGVRVDGGQRAVVALGHRVQHRDDLVAEHLADDDPARVHPQRAADQLGHADRALALAVRQPLLERDHVRVQLGEVVKAELQGALDGDQPLLGRDLVGQRAQQRRLPGVGRPGDHDVLPGRRPPRRGSEARSGVHGAVADQVGQEDLAHPGAPDGDRRAAASRPSPRTAGSRRAAAGPAAGWRCRTGGWTGRSRRRAPGSARPVPRRFRRPARPSPRGRRRSR